MLCTLCSLSHPFRSGVLCRTSLGLSLWSLCFCSLSHGLFFSQFAIPECIVCICLCYPVLGACCCYVLLMILLLNVHCALAIAQAARQMAPKWELLNRGCIHTIWPTSTRNAKMNVVCVRSLLFFFSFFPFLNGNFTFFSWFMYLNLPCIGLHSTKINQINLVALSSKCNRTTKNAEIERAREREKKKTYFVNCSTIEMVEPVFLWFQVSTLWPSIKPLPETDKNTSTNSMNHSRLSERYREGVCKDSGIQKKELRPSWK